MMSALMHFYIEVEQTGASSQFYDKFCERGKNSEWGRC
jgi:ubiquitin conjugation factor E4 B